MSTSVRLISHQAGACTPSSTPGWAKVSPASLTLQPGESRTATFRIILPASIGGTQDVGALFLAKPAKAQTGTASVGGIVVSRVVMRPGGSTTVPQCATRPHPQATTTPVAAAHQGNGTIPLAPIGGALLAVLVAVGAYLAGRHRRSSRT